MPFKAVDVVESIILANQVYITLLSHLLRQQVRHLLETDIIEENCVIDSGIRTTDLPVKSPALEQGPCRININLSSVLSPRIGRHNNLRTLQFTVIELDCAGIASLLSPE